MNDNNQQHSRYCFTLFFLRSLVGPVVMSDARRNHLHTHARNLSFHMSMKTIQTVGKVPQAFNRHTQSLHNRHSSTNPAPQQKNPVSGGKKKLDDTGSTPQNPY